MEIKRGKQWAIQPSDCDFKDVKSLQGNYTRDFCCLRCILHHLHHLTSRFSHWCNQNCPWMNLSQSFENCFSAFHSILLQNLWESQNFDEEIDFVSLHCFFVWVYDRWSGHFPLDGHLSQMSLNYLQVFWMLHLSQQLSVCHFWFVLMLDL